MISRRVYHLPHVMQSGHGVMQGVLRPLAASLGLDSEYKISRYLTDLLLRGAVASSSYNVMSAVDSVSTACLMWHLI